MEYLINVLMSFSTYFVSIILLLIVYVLFSVFYKGDSGSKEHKSFSKIVKKFLKILVIGILLFGLVVSFFGSANTPKNQQHNPVQLNNQIQSQNLNRTSEAVISDRSRQPSMTDQEREERTRELTDYSGSVSIK